MVDELSRRRGAYGFDAPHVPIMLGAGGVVLLGLGLLNGVTIVLLGGVFMLVSTGSFVYTTRAGKFLLWDEVLSGLGIRGDERILDMGCGRGGVLLRAAQLVPRGRAVGVDLWRTVDQSGNSEQATRRNAELEGVEDRIELHTADMTQMPFEQGRSTSC